MFLSIYIICFILSASMLVLLISHFKQHISAFYILLYGLFVIGTFGYIQLAISPNLEAAIFANQIIYICTTFAPVVVLLCMSDLCKFKFPVFLSAFFLISAIIVFACSCTVGRLPIFYKTIQFNKIDNITILTKEYGPLHILSPIFLILTAITVIGIFIYAISNKNKVSVFVTSMISVLLVFAVSAYCIKHILHTPYDYMPIVFAFSQFILFQVLKRIKIYDISGLSAESMLINEVNGFVICDNKGRYTGSDNLSKKWFPELMDLKVDRKIINPTTPFLQELCNWINGTQEKEFALFEIGENSSEKIIQVKHGIHYENKNSVHCFYLSDNTQQQKYARLIEHYNEELETQVQEQTEKIEKIKNDIITSVSSIVGDRDFNTGGHITRTSDVIKIFVSYLQEHNFLQGLPEVFGDRLIKAAPLHDFGKIAVSDVILNKPGKFTPEEYEQMKTHAQKGAVIVHRIFTNTDECDVFKAIAENIAYYHHEKWDGTGYPCKLSKEKIPFEARIMALADVFDALVSKRVYKEKFSYDQAFQIIKESSGTHFDPKLCNCFLECRPELEKLYDSYAS